MSTVPFVTGAPWRIMRFGGESRRGMLFGTPLANLSVIVAACN